MTSPDYLSNRLSALSEQQPWMHPETALALASSPQPDNTILSMAEGFRSSLANARTGFTDIFSDPVLTKTPTVHLAIKRYLNSTLGTWPITDEHLLDVQRNLQQMGYGKDLPVDGTWNSRWNSAWSQASQAEIGKQLAGDKTGSISTHTAAHSFLSAALPKSAFNAVVGFVKSIPGDVRSLAADTMGGVRGDVTALGSIFTGHSPGTAMHAATRKSDQTAASIERNLGSNITDEQYTAQWQANHGLGRTVQDIGTIFLLQSAMKAGSSVALAAGEGMRGGADLTLQQAASGPGVVSNLLRPGPVQVRAPGVIARTAFGGRTATEIESDVARRGLLNSRAVQNIPLLGRTGPVVGRLADANGLYYKTRTLLASPYRVPLLDVAGQAATHGIGLGIQARAVAGTSSALSGQENRGSLAQGVQGEHVIDHVDDAVRAATSNATGHRFSLGVDSLMWVLPGVQAGTHAAEHGERWLSNVNQSLGEIGALGALQRATGKNEQQLEEMAGGRANLTVWLRDKVFQAAADHHAERTLTLRDDVPTGMDKTLELQQLGHEALHDDDLLLQAAREVMADPHAFEMRLRAQIAGSSTHPDKWLRQDLEQYLSAGNIVRDRILGVPEYAKLLITPQSTATLKAVQDDADFSRAIGLKAAPERPNMTSAWLTGNNPDLIAGSVGTARLTTLTKQQALAAIDGFKAELQTVLAIPKAFDQVKAEGALITRMAEFAHQNFRLNSHDLEGLYGAPGRGDAETLAAVLEDHASQLATDVHIPIDAPKALRDAVDELHGKGYKLVFGTDIGHIFRGDLPPIDVMTGAVTRRRKIVSRLGLNPERFTDLQVGSAARIDVLSAVQKVLDKHPGEIPSGYDARSIERDLHTHDLLHPGIHDVGGLKGAAWGATAPARKRTVEFTAAQQGKSVEDVEKELRSEVMGYLSLRDLPESKIVQILTRTHDVPWTTDVALRDGHDGLDVPLMSDDMAHRIAKAIRVGYAQRPGYMIGAARLEDLARTGLGPLGKVRPDGTLMRRLDSAPNRYVQLRNWYRFQLSPMFSARRLVKTNFKAGLEGVPWTASPLKDMQQRGIAEDAFAVLDRIYPENKLRNEWMDEADRQLRTADILGLFNPRHFEARAAYEWKQQGKTDEQIRGLIQKTFHYGGTTAEGRTAAERTANVVFFPYSFSKTLYRNVGGYLMDHPAQALVIAAGLEAYRDFSTNHADSPLASKWLDAHLPVLQEMERLNAFSHGISPGELGGINAPLIKSGGGALLNFFMPQKWAANADTGKNIKRMIPAYTDFARVQKELTEQGRITATALGNSLGAGQDLITGTHRAVLDPRAPAMTGKAQRDKAYGLLYDLEDSYKTVLDYNAGHSNADDKYTFSSDPSIPAALRGQPISRAALKQVVHRFYPAYDPTKDALFAVARQQRITAFLDKNPSPEYRQFADLAKQVESYKNRDSYDPQQLAAITSAFRTAAVEYSAKDAKFRDFYKKEFTGTFGPIERLRGVYRKGT